MPRGMPEAAGAPGLASISVPEDPGGSGPGRRGPGFAFEAPAEASAMEARLIPIHRLRAWRRLSLDDDTVRDRHGRIRRADARGPAAFGRKGVSSPLMPAREAAPTVPEPGRAGADGHAFSGSSFGNTTGQLRPGKHLLRQSAPLEP